MLGYISYKVANGIYNDMIEDKLDDKSVVLVPITFTYLIFYTIWKMNETLKPIVITSMFTRIGKIIVDNNTIVDVSYSKTQFRFAFVAQLQKTVIIKLNTGENITIWKEHYWNGKKIKPVLEQLLQNKPTSLL
jgi:hypothetical protein